ncbi:MAG TPA: 3'(2'),5'-bisphosphate nucleotidase CysQ [Terriglobia bacterium]|nr:3'(2'),5'-bisphosphate nucleotidase CysQ [Terriglobia bacterium]
MIVTMDEQLKVAKKLAVAAGGILMDYYAKSVSVDWKAPGDPVTAADRDANEFIVANLRQEFPEHGVLSEEEEDDLVRLDCEYVWMIDPMDGTREFIDHREDFAVQIGLVTGGVPILGVVYQPVTQKLYYAAQGLGAFLEKSGTTKSLHVSTETKAANLTAAVSRSHRSARVDAIRDRLGVQKTIEMGSVGLKVGLVCEGLAQLYVHTGGKTKLWDTCGPEAILREAGGRMTDASNESLRYDVHEVQNLNGIVATNSVIHDRVIQVTQAVLASFR